MEDEKTTLDETISERGYPFLGAEVRRSDKFERTEVEEALRHYFALAEAGGKSGDWNAWADLFTEDAIYIEHAYGVFRGREAIRGWVAAATGQKPMDLQTADNWHIIDNDLCIVHARNFVPALDGGAPYNFNAMAVLFYAGEGQFCYEEDFYNPLEAARIMVASTAATERSRA